MAGIFGIIAGAGDPTEQVYRMAETMRHDVRDPSGSEAVNILRCCVGWVAHRGSYSDCMPVWNADRTVCLVFTGEHFASDRQASSARPTADELMSLYLARGAAFFRQLNGIFAGILLDSRPHVRKVCLFNDRQGLSRIYWHQSSNGFYFASEAKALLRVLPSVRSAQQQSLAELFACGCSLQNRSLFRNVEYLPPASQWTWEADGTAHRGKYFTVAELESLQELEPDEYFERMHAALDAAAPRYLQGPQKVAVSVTGGVDSRMVLAGITPPPEDLTTYTFGGMYREPADVRAGRDVAAACGLSHRALVLGQDFLGRFTELVSRAIYLTDGAIDATGAVSLYMNRAARELAPIRLTGNYGGEILRGITGLKARAVDKSIFDPEFAATIAGVPATLASEQQGRRATFITTKQIPWHHYARYAIEQSQLTVRTPFLDNELVPLAFQMPSALRLNKDLCYRYIFKRNKALAAIPTDRGTRYSPKLRHQGAYYRARRWMEELLPRAEYVYDYGMPNWLAAINRFVEPLQIERLFLGHQKYYHFRIWYRRELAAEVRSILLDSRTLNRAFLNRRRVEAIVGAHTEGRENHTLMLHKLITCELAHRVLLEQP